MTKTDFKNSLKSSYAKMKDSIDKTLKKVDSQIDKHFENFVFSFKIIIIILFVVWVCVYIVKLIYQYKLKKNNDPYNSNKLLKITKTLNIINDINYYLILIFTLIITLVMLFKLYPYANVVIQRGKEHLKNLMKKDQNKTHSTDEKAEIPTSILSMTYWLLFYFVFIIFIIAIDKSTKSENAAYYL